MHAQEILLRQSCMHVTLTARPWGVHVEMKLGESLNRQGCGMGSVGATTGESKTFKQMVHRSLEHE
jgi:hypothetical protein